MNDALRDIGDEVQAFYDRDVENLSTSDGNQVQLDRRTVNNGLVLEFVFKEMESTGKEVSHPYYHSFAAFYIHSGGIGVRTAFPELTLMGELEKQAHKLFHTFLRSAGFVAVLEPHDSPLPKLAIGPAIDFHYTKRL